MANRRTHAFTARGDGGLTRSQKQRRIAILKSLKRPLSVEELEELKKLQNSN